MGMRMPETCWAVFKWQAINLRICCIWLVDSVESMMMHGLAIPKIISFILYFNLIWSTWRFQYFVSSWIYWFRITVNPLSGNFFLGGGLTHYTLCTMSKLKLSSPHEFFFWGGRGGIVHAMNKPTEVCGSGLYYTNIKETELMLAG